MWEQSKEGKEKVWCIKNSNAKDNSERTEGSEHSEKEIEWEWEIEEREDESWRWWDRFIREDV